MLRQTEARAQAVAVACIPGAVVAFGRDGTAVVWESYTLECARCGALHDVEGEAMAFDPAEAWGLLQAMRRLLARDAYQRAAQAIMAAIEGS